jgi:hypothetical protein
MIKLEEVMRVIEACKHPNLGNGHAQKIYVLGVLAAWVARLAKSDPIVKRELDSRLYRNQPSKRK